MRLAPSLAAGLLLACLGIGSGSASPAVPPAGAIAGGTVEQARMVHRRTARRVMGLPVPGARKRYRRGVFRR